MAAHKWWRIDVSATGGIYCQLGEVTFLNASGVSLSSGGTAYASSVYGAGYEPAKAFDKNTGTEWCSAQNGIPAALWYSHPSPVDVAGVRLRGSDASYLPVSSRAVKLSWSDNGNNWYRAHDEDAQLVLTAGTWAANTDITLMIGQVPRAYQQAGGGIAQDWQWLQGRDVRGTVSPNNRVFLKDGSAPEVPMPGALVRLHRRIDGRLAWQGLSDAQGWYHPRHLEVGVEYVPLAIDPTGTHECVAAGPVTAVEIS